MTTPGKRVYLNDDGLLKLGEGEYGMIITGDWFVRPPGCHMGDISEHEVTEHEDGTISVSPSILQLDDAGKEIYHGWLTKGVWK